MYPLCIHRLFIAVSFLCANLFIPSVSIIYPLYPLCASHLLIVYRLYINHIPIIYQSYIHHIFTIHHVSIMTHCVSVNPSILQVSDMYPPCIHHVSIRIYQHLPASTNIHRQSTHHPFRIHHIYQPAHGVLIRPSYANPSTHMSIHLVYLNPSTVCPHTSTYPSYINLSIVYKPISNTTAKAAVYSQLRAEQLQAEQEPGSSTSAGSACQVCGEPWTARRQIHSHHCGESHITMTVNGQMSVHNSVGCSASNTRFPTFSLRISHFLASRGWIGQLPAPSSGP
jgi:hypothetical protein